MMKKLICTAFILFILSGCSVISGEDEDPPKEPTLVSFSMYTDDTVNPNVDGAPSPVEIQVFELSDDSMLLSAYYDQIHEDYEATLKSNYIKVYDYVLTPSQFKVVEGLKLDEDTKYLGVVAHFSEPENSSWKKTVKVESINEKYNIFLHIRGYEVSLEKAD